MKTLILSLTLLLCCSFQINDPVLQDKNEAQKAYMLLNDIRTNPAKYYKQYPFLKKLNFTKTKLIWNDTLAQVAEAKAYDMANRNYFGHVNPEGYGMNYYISKTGYALEKEWTANKKDNFFESIAAGDSTGENAINNLILDKGIPSLGHRKHLLGVEQWNAALVDIGIGFAKRANGSMYGYYMSVIIAKHHW